MCQFGPKLVEALAMLVLDEINILRDQHGLAPRTMAQALDRIQNHLSTLDDYDWMHDPP